MPRTAQSHIGRAIEVAKAGNIVGGVPVGMTAQALDALNALLAHIAATVDFSASRGQWNFTFNTNLISSGGGNIVTTGPNYLPIDYLRVPVSVGSSGAQRSSRWYLQGIAYPMIEIDLTELDDQVQQAGIQSYPYLWAKDMAAYQPIIEVTGNLDKTSLTVSSCAIIDTGHSLSSIATGMSIAGGIGPLSVIAPGTTLSNVAAGGATLTLSAYPTATMTGATLLIGNPAIGYAWPPPSGAYNAMVRYQRMMPRLTQSQVNNGAYCWFGDDLVIEEGLAGLMCRFTDDNRVGEFIGGGLGTGGGRFGARMAQYLRLADDNANRAQVIQMDRRTFGSRFSSLPNSKLVGW